ncbi:DUF4123 domain-containing protein [Vreelandella stevensii]|uniref:DUF4123 domain-containing protein n=1 Tax=Vreelandella stevensii TaxID=502821 RepID=UPI00403AC771
MKANALFPWQHGESEQAAEVSRYVLVELAPLPVTCRSTLFNDMVQESRYWSLIKDESQPHLQREGPWLLQLKQNKLEALSTLDGIDCALQGGIESSLPGAELAIHMAPAMVMENLHKQRSLLRFYLPDAITQLHRDAQGNPENLLFAGVNRWWYRNETSGWTALEGRAPLAKRTPWRLLVDDARWRSLHGDPEVMQMTSELVDFSPALFTGICGCERPRHVAKALVQADSHGLTATADRRTYVYIQLSEGEGVWAAEEMKALLQRAAKSEAPLADLLVAAHQQAEEC